MTPTKMTRFGLTLVEVLVVVAILSVIAGLALPAIQSSRSAASKMQCSNNLRQIGIALQNYHAVSGVFPPGVGWQNGTSPYPFMSWMTRLLPFSGNDTLWSTAVESFRVERDFRFRIHRTSC